MLVTIAAALFVLGVLILVHELGHYWAAKSVGIAVPRFSIGIGPLTPLKFRRGETDFVVSWIPFGGYVKMASREELEEGMGGIEGGELEETFPEDQYFESKPLWARAMVLSAGVFMNVVFAFVVYLVISVSVGEQQVEITPIASVNADELPESAAALADLPAGALILRINGDSIRTINDVREAFLNPSTSALVIAVENHPGVVLPIEGYDLDDRVRALDALEYRLDARIGVLDPGRPAAEAGMQLQDLVVGADGREIADWYELVEVIEGSPGREIEVLVNRDGQEVSLAVTPETHTQTDPETGEEIEVGRLGIGVDVPVEWVKTGLLGGFVHAGTRVYRDGRLILMTLKGLVLGKVSPNELGGPVFVGQLSGQVAREGILPLFTFMALFSVNLAILNLLPIPVLDGGHLVFLLWEGIRGKPMSVEARIRLTQVGLVFLLVLMVFVLTNDFKRILGF